MKKIEQLRTITRAARQATDEEIENLYEAIYGLCYESATIGNGDLRLNTADLEDLAHEECLCRLSSFDSSYCAAILRMRNDGFTINETCGGWKIVWAP
tara:strand:+ start:164 stop:457 length:294 start_codon:yes stop_codon:yes gene_type:complete